MATPKKPQKKIQQPPFHTKEACASAPEEEAALGALSFDRFLHAVQGRFTLGISPVSLALAWLDWGLHVINAPGKRADLSEKAIKKFLRYWVYCLHTVINPREVPCVPPHPHDKRFESDAWQKWPFNWLYQGFLNSQALVHEATTGIRGVSAHHEEVVNFTARQIMDIFSPSNFFMTNPEVLTETKKHSGSNLLAGLMNLIEDRERAFSGKKPVVTDGFRVGENIAVTKGSVVYRNQLIELIQYEPLTKKTHPEPILIVPAWIMKYYILDLSPENSMAKYLVENGYTVFMISWKNPGREERDFSFETYRKRGIMDALNYIEKKVTPRPVHAVGYCIGGTLLSITASTMARDGDERLKSITLMAAQVDFEEAGELKLFIDESQVTYLEDIMWDQGYLNTRQMAGAFQLLRSNDLLWSRNIHYYLMGQRPPGFDLMAWNADATRMPSKMHTEYLRNLMLNNELAEGKFMSGDKTITLKQINAPLFVVAAERDHVAPWRSVYRLHELTSTEITYLLTTGGHNAGIVSPPGRINRSYQMTMRHENDRRQVDPDMWRAMVQTHEGSWWTPWLEWLKERSSDMVNPPSIATHLMDAPGSYVHQQ